MNDKAGIPDSWILIDSQSTVDLFMNKNLLKNIRDTKNNVSEKGGRSTRVRHSMVL